MLPFAGPLALAALPFLFNKGTESVGGNTMETDDINEIANNYAMMTGGSPRVMPKPVMGGVPFMDRPADVDTTNNQPFVGVAPESGHTYEPLELYQYYSPYGSQKGRALKDYITTWVGGPESDDGRYTTGVLGDKGYGYSGYRGIPGGYSAEPNTLYPPAINQVSPSLGGSQENNAQREFPGSYNTHASPQPPGNVEMNTPSFREVNPLGYHMRQWYGMPGIMKGVDALKSIWGTPVANESNHAYYKGGTHKVAGIDPQKYARGDDDIQLEMDNWGYTDFSQPQYIPDVGGYENWGLDSIFNEQNFGTHLDRDKDWSRRTMPGGGTQVANVWDKWSENKLKYLIDLYKQEPRPDILRDINYLNWEHRHLKGDDHEAWNRFPELYNSGTSSVKGILGADPMQTNKAGIRSILGADPMQTNKAGIRSILGENPFQRSVNAGQNAMKDMRAREIQSMLNNLQRQPRLPLSSVGNLSKTLFRGGPLGAAISTAMTPTMAADATWSDAEWSSMMGGKKAMSDREMKQQLHSQKMRQNEEAHRAKMMAQ